MTAKTEQFVFCVDSDGCAMDTMTYKHQLFFGPLAADYFAVADQVSFLKEWDRINLYSRTRGVNRFVGLVMGLEFAGVSGIDALKKWVQETPSLSNQSLEAELVKQPSDDLQRALDWSNEVNRQIEAYKGEALAFPGALAALKALHQLGRVFVVSSANKEAVQKEWQDQGLMTHVDGLYCQDRGKKESVIAQLIDEGYARERMMMIGDSPGDLAAAEQNQITFFPILVSKEASSWQDLSHAAEAFTTGDLTELDVKSLTEAFWRNLDR
ncbi:HAD hydrolase-like protein [Streptococcus equi subsp. zooepidemicus]|uniref:HAD family hydrolase n=1 Tax=Streptococcus equi TaxID=1336 RepID=UPI001E309369|nr:HAD family hydrolase [Streptococcus equi]MCD3434157.1 HAD hydrolase-like protein [Streptococcus equi subsp. zooepidemicus]HEL1204866.1 HAD family hydrolase [Streptococcus equi subsp. zooepidemicus]